MTYNEMEKEIAEIPRFGAKASLSNLADCLALLNHPERELRVIHVAGTNGKGSVCAYMEAILRKAGYRTGLFTSPHLVKLKERFRIDFQICEEETLIWAWGQVKVLLNQAEKLCIQPLTFFEVLFLMGVLIFAEAHLDYCIMETGLGGRLDATVLTNPVLSILTSISFDHTAILGDTIEKIAWEKAGIIKKNVPIVTLCEPNGAFPIIEKTAKEKNAKIYKVSYEEITILKKYENKIDFSFNSRYYKNDHLSIMSCANYQAQNAALALVSAKVLLPQISGETLQSGLLMMRWEGRMEEFYKNVYIDGAHNPGAVAKICESIADFSCRWILLFAVCADKDYGSMIAQLAGYPWKKIFITGIEETRGASVEEVRQSFVRSTSCPICSFDTANEAFAAALQYKEKEDRLLCLGSLYLIGELKRRKDIFGK